MQAVSLLAVWWSLNRIAFTQVCLCKYVFALGYNPHDIKLLHPGVRILAEPPLAALPRQVQQDFDSKLLLRTISKTRRDAFHQLSDCKLTGTISQQGIFETNNFFLGDKQDVAAVFAITSRFNHSCVHNCTHTWNSNLGMMTVHTDQQVRSGDQLTVSYRNFIYCDRKSRQDSLRNQFNFSCHCEVSSVRFVECTKAVWMVSCVCAYLNPAPCVFKQLHCSCTPGEMHLTVK